MKIISGEQQTKEYLEREIAKLEMDEMIDTITSHIEEEYGDIFRQVLYPTFDDLSMDMNNDIKTYHNTSFLEAVVQIVFAQPKTPYPLAFQKFTKNVGHGNINGLLTHLFQYHSTALFKYWQQKSAVVYEPNEKTYDELRGNTDLYRKVEDDSVMMIQDHPVQEKPFQPFLLKHHDWAYSLLMWIDPKETQIVPSIRDYKRFRKTQLSVQTNLAVKNLHKGYVHDQGKGLFVYVEYLQCWVDNQDDDNYDVVEDIEKVMEANAEYIRGVIRSLVKNQTVGGITLNPPYAQKWRTKVMVFDKNTLLDPIEHSVCLTHLNLLTCLQNPKTVVTQTNRPTKQQRKKAKRKREKPLTTKTLLVETETLHQINPLRANSNTVGGKHSYQYERSACEAKKWVLEANLETGMEVIAKKPRKNGDGYLYLVKGKRKGAVCNAHLPLKEKTVQTVKVKSFKI